METSQSTDHNNSCTHTSPETAETDFRVDLSDVVHCATGSLHVVELGDHSISRLRDQSAEDTSNVTRAESDGELSALGVLILWLSEDVFVEGFDCLFESDELHDGIWDLSGPEGRETLVETVHAFISSDLTKSTAQISGESAWLGGLDSNLNLYIRSDNKENKIFTASQGQRRTSAITSALAEERAKPRALYLTALSGPTSPAKTSLKSS